MVLTSDEVSKVYVMSKEETLRLLTEACIKCHHLVDDHLRKLDSKGKYKCRNCECEID